MALKFPDKDPDEKLDYTIDWSRYLNDLTINSVQWKVIDSSGTLLDYDTGEVFENDAVSTATGSSVGLIASNQVNTNTTATIVLDKGVANTTYRLMCEITTSTSAQTGAAIVTQREVLLRVRERP